MTGQLDVWERRGRPLFAALPYAMLLLTTVITVATQASAGHSWVPDLVLGAVTASWMWGMHTARPAWRERTPVMVVFFAGLIALMTIMVIRNPWSGFFTFTGYFYVYDLPTWPGRVLGVLAVATLTGTSQVGGFATVTDGLGGLVIYLTVVMVNAIVAGAFAWFGFVNSTQHERRGRLVEELHAANERLEATLAENAGLHQQLLVQAREAGVLDERQRMAREIHDTLAQGLTGIITQLQAADQASDDPVARRRHVDSATRLARDSLTEARRSVDALRPQPLERARLGDALASVADSWSPLHGVAASVTVTGTPCPMAADVEFALLRTAQEALANVGRHAAATRVGLTLSYMDDGVTLDVRDDGRGFDATRVPSGGFGLVAMRERIEALAGTLHVESEPGRGTAVSARLPFRAAEVSPQAPAQMTGAG